MAKPEYEGKAKQIIPTEDPEIVVQRFKDSATAFNGKKYAEFQGKGQLNCAISSFLFEKLNEAGVATHFIERSTDVDMVVKRLRIIPLEVVVRNVVARGAASDVGM